MWICSKIRARGAVTSFLLALAFASAGTASASALATDTGAPARQQVDEQALRADMQRAIEQRRRELLPEYERRVRSDGRASADDWLRARATELGRRDGEAIRRNHSRGKYDAGERVAPSSVADDARARHQRGDPACERLVTRHRAVANVSGGPMQMVLVTECAPAAKPR